MEDSATEHFSEAKLAEQLGRYEEMALALDSFARERKQLSIDDRNLLSLAFKNAINERRAALRCLATVESREITNKNEHRLPVIRHFALKIEKELVLLSTRLIRLLDDCLIPNLTNVEASIFFHKMKGDYLRYIVEYNHSKRSAETRTKVVKQAHNCYQHALSLSQSELPASHPLRLGLVLNYSVFLFEILHDERKAWEVAKLAVTEAEKETAKFKDSFLIVRLIQDNVSLWGTVADLEPAVDEESEEEDDEDEESEDDDDEDSDFSNADDSSDRTLDDRSEDEPGFVFGFRKKSSPDIGIGLSPSSSPRPSRPSNLKKSSSGGSSSAVSRFASETTEPHPSSLHSSNSSSSSSLNQLSDGTASH
eukprot:TRINITY_DN4617_c0_g3_i2.p1 TRINITY_DN4617_c0_g3~~TRINITY_DN4617_c0_g3_i2.p1  ORF type:complete len:405 (+),score=149.17 TRINITY_DN4617_c0_g3_i2:122-1216(+)